MRTVRRSTMAFATATALVGCSYLVDTRGFTEDAPAVSDGGGAESGMDAALVGDAGGPASEAGADAASVTALDCSKLASDPTVVLCDTFDHADPGTGWSFTDQAGSGAVSIATVDGNAVLRSVATASNGEAKAATRENLANAPTKRLSVAARLRWKAYPTNGVQTLVVSFGAFPNNKAVVLHVTDSGLFVFEQSFGASPQFFQYTLTSTPAPDTWVRAELAVAFGAPSTITLSLDGKNVLTQASQIGLASVTPQVGVGVTYAGPASAFELLTDDVVIRAE